MFVFLGLSTLCEGHTAAKWYWRPLSSKRSLPVLKWTSESEYFLSFKNLFTLYIYNPVQEQSLDPSLCMRGAG